MDHSMATAIEAANNIKNNITDKSNVWNVNTEKEYHEERKENNNAHNRDNSEGIKCK